MKRARLATEAAVANEVFCCSADVWAWKEDRFDDKCVGREGQTRAIDFQLGQARIADARIRRHLCCGLPASPALTDLEKAWLCRDNRQSQA